MRSVIAALALAGCVSSPADPFEFAENVVWVSLDDASGRRLRIYIEGDGAAFDEHGRPSEDPTPKRSVALRLAKRDGSTARAYVARPCQYAASDELCRDPRVWTEMRFEYGALSRINAAIEQAKSSAGAEEVELIGYSGGGVVAVMLTRSRDDIVRVTTLAAPLDLNAWSEFHSVTPVRADLDPVRIIEQLEIPQIHILGARDSITPPKAMKRAEEACGRAADCHWIVRSSAKHGDWKRLAGDDIPMPEPD